jgi:hypothetical protein
MKLQRLSSYTAYGYAHNASALRTSPIGVGVGPIVSSILAKGDRNYK